VAFGLLLPKPFELFGFAIFWLWAYMMKGIQSFDFERTWWSVFNLLTLSVHDEVYSIFWLWVYMMKGIQSFDFDRTWWRVFNLLTLSVHDEGYSIFWLWVYMMKGIPEMSRAH
jgi:hypothetical protein